MINSIFTPSSDNRNDSTAWAWLQNIEHELKLIPFTDADRQYLIDYYQEAGLLSKKRQPFFKRHYAQTLATTLRYLTPLLKQKTQPKLLDLGCGAGTQSLLFACLGFHVIAVDGDENALAILKKRKAFYESHFGHPLQIDILCGNTLTIDYMALGPFQAVHSLFAFNMMQPSSVLIDKLIPSLGPHARIFIQDGNRLSYANRWLPHRRRQVLSPLEMARYFSNCRCKTLYHQGGVSLPPIAWHLSKNQLLEKIDHWCNQRWSLPISHHFIAEFESN